MFPFSSRIFLHCLHVFSSFYEYHFKIYFIDCSLLVQTDAKHFKTFMFVEDPIHGKLWFSILPVVLVSMGFLWPLYILTRSLVHSRGEMIAILRINGQNHGKKRGKFIPMKYVPLSGKSRGKVTKCFCKVWRFTRLNVYSILFTRQLFLRDFSHPINNFH